MLQEYYQSISFCSCHQPAMDRPLCRGCLLLTLVLSIVPGMLCITEWNGPDEKDWIHPINCEMKPLDRKNWVDPTDMVGFDLSKSEVHKPVEVSFE